MMGVMGQVLTLLRNELCWQSVSASNYEFSHCVSFYISTAPSASTETCWLIQTIRRSVPPLAKSKNLHLTVSGLVTAFLDTPDYKTWMHPYCNHFCPEDRSAIFHWQRKPKPENSPCTCSKITGGMSRRVGLVAQRGGNECVRTRAKIVDENLWATDLDQV
jgi:hypothetical protein